MWRRFSVTLRYSPKSFIKDLRDGALPGEEFIEKGRENQLGKINREESIERYMLDILHALVWFMAQGIAAG